MIRDRIKTVLSLLAVILLLALFYFVYQPVTPQTSHQASAQIVSVTGMEIIASGVHIIDDSQDSDLSNPQSLTIKIDANTRFFRKVWRIPAKAGDPISPPVREQRESQEAMEELKNMTDQTIMVQTQNNSLNDTVLTASQIDYSLRISAQ